MSRQIERLSIFSVSKETLLSGYIHSTCELNGIVFAACACEGESKREKREAVNQR